LESQTQVGGVYKLSFSGSIFPIYLRLLEVSDFYFKRTFGFAYGATYSETITFQGSIQLIRLYDETTDKCLFSQDQTFISNATNNAVTIFNGLINTIIAEIGRVVVYFNDLIPNT